MTGRRLALVVAGVLAFAGVLGGLLVLLGLVP